MKKLRSLNKKDWILFWIFAALIANVIGNFFNHRINDLLRKFGNPWLTNLNEPQSYGRLITASVLLAVMAVLVLFLLKKSLKAKIAAIFAGILIPAAIVGIYFIHCNLIVSVLWNTEPQTVFVDDGDTCYYIKTNSPQGTKISSKQSLSEILELCRTLTPITDEAQIKKCMDWYENAEEPFLHTDMVRLYFPEKYGHHYQFSLRLHEGYVYLWRGYSDTQEITFFEDNGITKWAAEYVKTAPEFSY